MSGRPQGPYTVKNRRPVTGRPNSAAVGVRHQLVGALGGGVERQRMRGRLWCTENGIFVLAPYTELVEAYTRCCTPLWRQPSSTFSVPVTLLST